jgi:hypothetical protein
MCPVRQSRVSVRFDYMKSSDAQVVQYPASQSAVRAPIAFLSEEPIALPRASVDLLSFEEIPTTTIPFSS